MNKWQILLDILMCLSLAGFVFLGIKQGFIKSFFQYTNGGQLHRQSYQAARCFVPMGFVQQPVAQILYPDITPQILTCISNYSLTAPVRLKFATSISLWIPVTTLKN